MKIKEILNSENHGYDCIVEADIVITDGTFDITCYYYGIGRVVEEGTKVEEVTSLFAEDIMRAETNEFIVTKKHGDGMRYAYFLQGKVIDKSKPLVAIGNIVIHLDDPLPKDIDEGEFVEFVVTRLDCFV